MLHHSLRTLLTAALLSTASIGLAADSDEQATSIRLIDRTGAFLEFYERAIDAEDHEQRFALWQKHYNFVALPPGLPDRDDIARAMLESAWPQYPLVLDQIRAGASVLQPPPEQVIAQVAELLNAVGQEPAFAILLYVGMMEGNAFFAPQPDGQLIIALPVETASDRLDISMAHEIVHAFHHVLAGDEPGATGSVAELVLTEGIAMHGTRALFPEQPDFRHMSPTEDWVQTCHARIDDIIDRLSGVLADTGPEAVNQLTVGSGLTGLEREAYCAGWHLVGHLLGEGKTLAELARIPGSEAVRTLTVAINAMQEK
jgi:hypothetical protein